MHLYRSRVYQDASNLLYAEKIKIESAEDLLRATNKDYMPWLTNGKRRAENVVQCDVIYHDYDNDHSENPEDWITLEKCKDEIYAGIEAYFIASRNHNVGKDGKKARPKFHVFCPAGMVIDTVEKYTKINDLLKNEFPFADRNALDPARFFYGVESPAFCEYQPGITIIQWLDAKYDLLNSEKIEGDFEAKTYREPDGKVTKSARNNALKAYAGHIKYDFLERDKEELFETLWNWNLKKCEPPLTESEIRTTVLKSTWKEVLRKREIVRIERGEKGRKYELNDIGDAKYLHDTIGDKFRWCYDSQYWMYYDNGVWAEDKYLRLQEATKKVMLDRLREVKNIKEEINKEKFIKHIGGLCNYNTRERVIRDTKSLLPIISETFDKDNYLLNCPNGTLNLKTFDFYDHDHREYHSKMSGVPYIPSQEPPKIFLDFLQTTFQGDKELLDYVQKIMGFSLTGDASRQEFYILWGNGGNGKSQLVATLRRVLGTYAYGVPAKNIMESKFQNNSTYIAQLRGVRALFCTEGEEKAHLDVSLVKQLTDEDMPMNVAQKYERAKQFCLTLHPFLITNPLPRVENNEDATWRRIRLIPFCHKVRDEDKIFDYANKMLDAGASGIFNWYIEGLKKYYSEGIKIPDAVLQNTAKYKTKSDQIELFISECCETGEEYNVETTALHEAWKKYTGRKNSWINDFIWKIEERFTKGKNKDKHAAFFGLRLLQDYERQESNPFDNK